MEDLGNILKVSIKIFSQRVFFSNYQNYKNLQACGYPVYWKSIVCIAAAGDKAESVTYSQFVDFWRKMIAEHHDEASQVKQLIFTQTTIKWSAFVDFS